MAYELQAVIADEELLRGISRDLPAARTAPLGQGLSLVPMTDELFLALTDGSVVDSFGFWRLPGGADRRFAEWSAAGPVAYAEAEFFGGVGEQRAAVWAGGAVVLGPLHGKAGELFPPPGSPISQALRRLGVLAGAAEDEFSAVALGRHRRCEDWIG